MNTAFFDVDTQLDFVLPAGALYVPGAESILPAVVRLNRWAAEHSIPLISTMDAHAENDPEFVSWPPHAVAGAAGQRKPSATLVGSSQILLPKQALDSFSNPELPRLLDKLDIRHCIVYGVASEYCVRLAALGLLRGGRDVEVVTDAIKPVNEEHGVHALEEIVRLGGRLTTVDAVVG